MSTKISCGGFYVDDEIFSLENEKLSIKNSIPQVESTDKDKFLHTNKTTGNIEWAEVSGSSAEDFLITCTPTAQNLSGTMDKSPSEITEAYYAGKNIKFKILMDDYDIIIIPTNYNIITDGNNSVVQLMALTTITEAGTYNTYLLRALTSITASTYSINTYTLTSSQPLEPEEPET